MILKFSLSSGSYTVNADSSVNIIAEEAAPLSDFDKDVRIIDSVLTFNNHSGGFIILLIF